MDSSLCTPRDYLQSQALSIWREKKNDQFGDSLKYMCFLDSKNSVRHYQFGERKKNYQFGHSLNIWISWILTTYSFFLNIMYCIFANAQLILDPQPYQGFALKYKVNISTSCYYLLSKWSYRNHRHRGNWLPAQQDEFWWSYISRASTVVFWLFQYAMKTTSFHMQ